MKPSQRQYSLLLLQLCLTSCLVWGLMQQTRTEPATTPVSAPPAIALNPVSFTDLQRSPALSTQQQQQVLSRPLFTASRRPTATVTELQQQRQISDLTDWQLSGIITTGQVAVAMFKSDDESKALKTGMQLDNWTLTHISRSGVTFTQDGEQVQLRLHRRAHGS